jgi:Tol biopolymer transport system component
VEVYDESSDIILYAPDKHEILLDSILASKDGLENYPVFSPNGKTLYYCAAQRVDSIWKNYQQVKYNICRIDFDPQEGRFVGTPDTIVHARQAGKSANMPRVSYDGRFLLYTVCDYGCFPVWHPEADLWITDLQSGEAYPLTEANSHDAESFHNWSLNSRWIVFTSRRDDGLYTNLYFAHVSVDGKVSKAFRLPQRNPKEFDEETVCSFNTPDFASGPVTISRQQLYQKIMSSDRQGHTLIKP